MPQIIVKGVSASRMEKLASPMIETVSRFSRNSLPAFNFLSTKKDIHTIVWMSLAPPVWLEQTTLRLTAACSTD